MLDCQIGSLLVLFYVTPVKSALLTLGPIGLAAAQLANSYANGLPPELAIGFALGMVAFAVVATGHHAAEYRLHRLESRFGPAE